MRRVAILICALAAIVAPAVAQELPPPHPTSVIVAADMREGVDLSGPWHYSIDPFRSGIAGFHGEAPDTGQQRWRDVDVRAEMAKDSRVLYEFDLAHSPLTSLPSSWLTAAPELRHYDGLMWYQRTFASSAKRTGRYFLRFGAANYATVVYLNGQEVGRHEGGFTPFAFEVTRLLRDGENQITVGVDSQANEATVPPPVTDWENYGGITRAVRLIAVPDTYVDDAWMRLTRDGRIAVDAHLDGPAAGAAVDRCSVTRPCGRHRRQGPLARGGGGAGFARSLVARSPATLRRYAHRGAGPMARPDRVPDDRATRRRYSAQRQADFSARHFDA